MKILDLNQLDDDSLIHADLCIVGTGPTGVSIATQLARANINVVMIESGGFDPEPDTQALYEIEAELPRLVNQDSLRRRIVGGSSYIWTGRCAPFHEVDLEERSWVPNSGWPIKRAEFEPWLTGAGALLGLGPNQYDETLWEDFKSPRPNPPLNTDVLEPMFWQFSKSPRNQRISVDFGKDRLDRNEPNIQLVLHANLTHIDTNHDGSRFQCAEIRSLSGKRACVRAKALILCCGGVENARLLLASNRSDPRGIGNQHDLVGRFLMDHSDCVVGSFDPNDAAAVRSRFGHYWLDNNQGRHVYLHGLRLSRRIQEQEQLLNCHAYVDAFDVGKDDPWSALDRLKGSQRKLADVGTVLSHSGELMAGMYRRGFKHRPQLERLSRVELHCILEQIPDPESRVTLSKEKQDALGMPISAIDWKISKTEWRTACRMTELLCEEFRRLGLPAPAINSWVHDYRDWMFHCVEKAHPTGSTRMSDNPQQGVVDRNCQVHGVDGLYVCGSSVFPTSGAANPTLMIIATALRLADCLKTRYAA